MATAPFKLDKKFIAELHRRLQTINKSYLGEKFRRFGFASIPSRSHLEQIISEMFWASTQVEEGRPLQFKVAYNIAFLTPEHLGFSFDFESFRPWNAEELRRLAPAVAPPDGVIFVNSGDPHDPRFSKKNLYIEGLGTQDGMVVEFEVLEPARLVVRFPLNEIVAEVTSAGYGFIDDDWNRRAWKLLSTYSSDTDSEQKGRLFSILYGSMMGETLKRIRLLRHGGTLIFVKSKTKWEKSVEKSSGLPKILHPYNGLRHLADGLRSEISRFPDLSDDKSDTSTEPMNIWETAMKTLGDARFSRFKADAARTLAYLSAVDGAVVSNMDFDVLGFGLKIVERLENKKEEYVRRVYPYEDSFGKSQGQNLPLTSQFRGKRHLSAARFVLKNPDSRAFTVSQDGGVTCFVVENGELVAYSDLELVLP